MTSRPRLWPQRGWVSATARKIAVLFYNAVRHGMEYVDPGTSSYDDALPHASRQSTISIGVPRHSGLFSSPWSPKPVLPFLRNRSPASTLRSWHAATSHRLQVLPAARPQVRKPPKHCPQAAISTP